MIRSYAPILALAATLGAQAQSITSVTTSPSNLTECTLVTLTINGQLPGGVAPTNFNLGTQIGNTVPITIITGSSSPGGAFSVQINLGPYPPGVYTFDVDLEFNNNIVDNETIQRTIAGGVNPDAGLYAEHDFCTSAANVTLLSLLGGTPDPGGDWLDPLGNPVPSGIFDPGTSPAGLYSYSFNVLPPCIPAFQTLLINYLPNNDPGTPGTVQVCADGSGGPVDLFLELGGTPMTGGTWTKPGGAAHSGTYVPGVDNVGVYTYTLPGIPPCAGSSSTVTVQSVQPPAAGNDGAGQVCYNDANVQLNQFMSGNPQTTGIWFDPFGFSLGSWNTVISALTSDPGTYTYVVFGTICSNDTSLLQLTFLPPPCTPGFDELEGDVVRFDVMPNPSDGHVAIELEMNSTGGRLEVEVLNVNGQLVHTDVLQAGSFVRHDMDLTGLAKGLYTVRLTSDGGRAVRRMVIR